VKENGLLLDYPFDLYQRTRDIAEIVEIIARETGRQQLRILDVGGFRVEAAERKDLLLREFLGEHVVYALDLAECDIRGYVRGNGLQLPFKDGVFDVVVSSDVFEHIPGPKRGEFVGELLRVTAMKGFVVLGAPFFSGITALAEEILFEFVHKTLYVGQAQLKEHIENGLPMAADLEKMLRENGLAFTCFDSGRLDGWLMRLMVEHYLMTIPDTQRLRTMLNRYYNMESYESDHAGEGYRKVFVMAKERATAAVLEQIKGHFAVYAEKGKGEGILSGNLEEARLLLDLEELRTRRLFQEKDRIIEQQAAQIEAFNHMRTTRVYRFIQFFNRLFFRPFVRIFGKR
jgi:O-antigen biosynthesis protein